MTLRFVVSYLVVLWMLFISWQLAEDLIDSIVEERRDSSWH